MLENLQGGGNMTQIVDAVYEHGVFRPIHPSESALVEGQEVRLIIETGKAQEILHLASQVYAGLSPIEIAEVERIATNRNAFFASSER